jgi:hypothetical protein
MVEFILIKSKSGKKKSFEGEITSNKFFFDFSEFNSFELQRFDLEIVFKIPIISFRNNDYKWVSCDKERIANEFCPKIIKLENGFFVQPNINYGIWEINPTHPKTLVWRFNPENSNPISQYTGNENAKKIIEANTFYDFSILPSLLFSNKNAIEFSRSKIPFTAIATFTDHCDFDTLESIQLQRAFFKERNIKVTKGFFLNHFSKRADNASYENDSEELLQWKKDGHELAYHSLSQSLKPIDESLADFFNFKPPFDHIATWIDHGYQPYNFTLYQNNNIDVNEFSTNLKSKNINILWNYIDSGTSTIGVINQLNRNDFTLSSFYKGILNHPFKDKLAMMIKNIIFHFYADRELILKYGKTAGSFKRFFYQRKVKSLFTFINCVFSLLFPILKVFLFWKSNKNKPYKLANYSPLFFKHKIRDNEFYIFQTLEMVDFKKALHNENIIKLIDEKGIFIAHTYFAVPMKFHTGRIFKKPNQVDDEVAQNFANLGEKIAKNEIWNPTLVELVDYLIKFERTELDVDSDGKIVVSNSIDLIHRIVN